ncbi:MAG: pilus assembly protein [Proteobacteria bacterium]|nr:pilus assembly protein [Pseudomonadota bacterium]
MRRGTCDERGVAAVEFALILPLLLILMFGIVEFGLAWYSKQVVTNASREGARAGIVWQEPKMSDSEITAVVQNYLTQSGFTQPVTVTVTGAGGPSGDPLSVRVSHNYQFNVLPGFVASVTGQVTIQSTTVMRHE